MKSELAIAPFLPPRFFTSWLFFVVGLNRRAEYWKRRFFCPSFFCPRSDPPGNPIAEHVWQHSGA
jgi:hypothetical protein